MVYVNAYRERDFNAHREEGRVVTLASPSEKGDGRWLERDYRIVLSGAKHEPDTELLPRHITIATTTTPSGATEHVALIRRKNGAHDFVIPTRNEMLALFRGEAINLCTRLIRSKRKAMACNAAADGDGDDDAPSMYDTDPDFHELELASGQKYKLPKILPRVFQIVYKTCVRRSRSHYKPSSSSVAPPSSEQPQQAKQCAPWSEEAIAQRKNVMAGGTKRSSSASGAAAAAAPDVPHAVRAQYATSPLDINKINDNDDFISKAARNESSGEISIPLRAKVMSALTNSAASSGTAPSKGAASRAHAPAHTPAAPRKNPTAGAAAAAAPAVVVPTVVAQATAGAASGGAKKRKTPPAAAAAAAKPPRDEDDDDERAPPAPPAKKARTHTGGPSTKQAHEFYENFGLKSKQFSEKMAEFYKDAGLTKKATLEDKYNVLLSTFREQCDKPPSAMPSLGANFFFAYTLIERFREQERAAELRPMRDKAAKWDAHVAETAAAAAAAKQAAALINKKKTPPKQPIQKIFDDDDDDADDDDETGDSGADDDLE